MVTGNTGRFGMTAQLKEILYRSIQDVLNHTDSQLLASFESAKDATNTMSQTPENLTTSNQDGPSVPDVIFQASIGPTGFTESTQGCTTCKTVTLQFNVTLDAIPFEGPTPEIATKMMEVRRNLNMCSHCGTFRVTK